MKSRYWRPVRSRHFRERGAAAVEMAIVLPILLMIVFGIIDFGRMLNAQVTLTEAAREGARSAAFAQTDTATRQRVASVVTGLPGTPTCTSPAAASGPTCTTIAGCTSGATDATVTVTYTFAYVTPFGAFARMFGAGPGSTVAMSGRGVMACSS